jgi:hypothetical protein
MDGVWLRSEPDIELMGPAQTLETEHFTLHYRALDASAVAEAGPRLDQLYEKMRRDFDLPASAGAKIIVETVMSKVVEDSSVSYGKRTLTVRSPALLSVPVEMSAATVYYQSLVYPLASLVLTDVVDPYPASWKVGAMQWRFVLNALRLWELWEDGGALAAGHEDVLRWLYQNTQPLPEDAHNVLPEGYDHFCRTYRVLGRSPWATFIPLTCNELLEASRWSPWPRPGLLLRLGELSPLGEYVHPSTKLAYRVVSSETIIEYIVASYGQDRLPELVAGLGRYDKWETLLPAVLGVSATEFEAGWQAYLAEQYAVAPSENVQIRESPIANDSEPTGRERNSR